MPSSPRRAQWLEWETCPASCNGARYTTRKVNQTCWQREGTHHLQDGGVAANDEGKAAEALDTVGNAHRQLLVQVLGTTLQTDRVEGWDTYTTQTIQSKAKWSIKKKLWPRLFRVAYCSIVNLYFQWVLHVNTQDDIPKSAYGRKIKWNIGPIFV